MHYMNSGICPNCGKEFPLDEKNGTVARKYCSMKCRKEYAEKKAERQKLLRKTQRLSDTLVPQERCRTCRYAQKCGPLYHCGYFLQLDTTRTALHPEGLTADCKEYEPKGRTRKQ